MKKFIFLLLLLTLNATQAQTIPDLSSRVASLYYQVNPIEIGSTNYTEVTISSKIEVLNTANEEKYATLADSCDTLYRLQYLGSAPLIYDNNTMTCLDTISYVPFSPGVTTNQIIKKLKFKLPFTGDPVSGDYVISAKIGRHYSGVVNVTQEGNVTYRVGELPEYWSVYINSGIATGATEDDMTFPFLVMASLIPLVFRWVIRRKYL